MVGGDVIEVLVVDAERIWINCQDTVHRKTTCAINVRRSGAAERVPAGDMVWWQGRTAFHTPAANRVAEENDLRQGIDYEIELERIGYSGVSRPGVVN